MIVPLGLLITLNLTVIYPTDFWWHLRTGQLIVSEHHIPRTDLFTFTRFGEPWINQAWLMQAGFYLLYRAGGLPLIIFAHALMITTGYSLVLRVVTRYYGLRIGVLATLIGAALATNNWAPRPQSISFLGFGLLVYLIEEHRQGKTRRLWWALPLFALWANAHGAFVYGIAALGFYTLGRLWEFWRGGTPQAKRREVTELAAIGVLALAVLGLTPEGPLGIVRYILGLLQSEAVTKLTQEYRPLVIRQWHGALFFASLLFLVAVIVKSGFRPRADQVLNLLVFAVMSLSAQRSLTWFGFVLPPILAAGLRTWWRHPRIPYPGIRLLNGLILGLLGLAVLVTLPWGRQRLPLPPDRQQWVDATTPIEATEFLCATLPDDARILQHQAFASYQIWACPRLRVFIDTRNELFPVEQWQDYFAVGLGLFNWESVADKYQVTHLFLSTKLQPDTIKAALASPRWQEIYRDDRAVILAKRQNR